MAALTFDDTQELLDNVRFLRNQPSAGKDSRSYMLIAIYSPKTCSTSLRR